MTPVDPTDVTSNLASGGSNYLPPASGGSGSRPVQPNDRGASADKRAEKVEDDQTLGTPSAALVNASTEAPLGLPQGDSRYLPSDELGHGGWGRVERALDKQLDRDVAVKRINRELAGSSAIADRFFDEARVTGRLQHPGIVPVHELGIGEDGAPFYVMKLLEGVTFKQTIRDVHDKPEALADGFSIELLDRFSDVCNAVAYSHQQAIIHRDLKPSNIMVGEFGETIVVDWGLAKEIEPPVGDSPEEDPDATLGGVQAPPPTRLRNASRSPSTGSQSNAVLGTPAYMSPEQSEGEAGSLTPATDIYALGVILYEVLTGENPFRSKDTETTLSRVRAGEYKPPREVNARVPRALAAICTTAMSHRPEDRYERAEQIVEDLQRFLAGDSVSVYRDPWWARVLRWCRRRPALTAGVLGSVLVLTVSSVVFGAIVQRAHRAERRARMAAEESRKGALERLAESRAAGDAWLVDLSGSLQFFPGMSGLRGQLLEQATEHYERLASQLATDKRADATSILELARCHLRLGDLNRLRDLPEISRKHYQHALKKLAEAEATWETRAEQTNARIGLTLLGDAVDRAEDAAWLQRQLSNARLDAAATDQAANTFGRFALASIRSGDSVSGPPAIELLADAETKVRHLVDRRGEPRDHQLLQTLRDELAPRLQQAGNLSAARDLWSAEVQRLEQLTAAKTDRPDLLQSLAFSRMRLADLERVTHRDKQASGGYRTAIAELEEAWRLADPNAYYRRNVAASHLNLSRSEPDEETAQSHLAQAISQLRQAVAVEGPSAGDLARLAECYESLGDVASRLGKPDATARYNSAEQCYVVLGDHGQLTAALTGKRARNLIALGEHELQRTNDPEAAAAALDHATELIKETRAKRHDLTDVEWCWVQRLDAQLLKLRAHHGTASGDDDTARQLRKQSLARLRALALAERDRGPSETYPSAMQALFDSLVEHEDLSPESLAEATSWLRSMPTTSPNCEASAAYQQRKALLHWLSNEPDLARVSLNLALQKRPQNRVSLLLLSIMDDASEAEALIAEAPGDSRLRFWAVRFKTLAN